MFQWITISSEQKMIAIFNIPTMTYEVDGNFLMIMVKTHANYVIDFQLPLLWLYIKVRNDL